MDIHAFFGILAATLGLFGSIPYILAIRRREISPNFASWLGWTVLLLIGAIAQIAKGASWTVIVPITGAIGDAVVSYLAFRYGHARFSMIDILCLLIGGLALILWATTREPLVALILVVSADFIVGIPTIIKTYRKPTSENLLPWTFYLLATIAAFGATPIYDVNNLAFPVTLTLLNGIVFFILLRHRLKKV